MQFFMAMKMNCATECANCCNLNESYKHNIELEKADAEEYLLHDSIYIKFKQAKL